MSIESLLQSEIERCDDVATAMFLQVVLDTLHNRANAITKLQTRLKKLNALERNGVDNWEWYDEAMSELDDDATAEDD